MYGLLDWQFWLSAIWFVIAITASYYLPGSNLLRRFKLAPTLHYLLSFVLGLALWGGQAYLFGYLGWRWLTYAYLILNWSWWGRSWSLEKDRLTQARLELSQISRWPLVALFGGSFIQLLQVITTGLKYDGAIGFFRINAYDGVLHLAFIQALLKQVPAEQPGAVGLSLSNYHYWSDLVVADLVRIWHLPIIHTFFQFMPIVLALGTGIAVWQLIKFWGGKTSTVVWSLLLLYLAGDGAYIFALLLHRTWGAEVAAIDNGATQLLNIPHSYAKFVFITALMPLTNWLRQKSLGWGLITIALLASLTGLKVYFAIFSALGLSLVVGIYLIGLLIRSWKKPAHLLSDFWQLRWLWLPFGLLALLSAAIYFPANHNSGGLFWSPLEWPRLFLGRDHLNWLEWWQRKQVYDAASNLRGILFMDALAIMICLISVFGFRLLGLLPELSWYKKLGWPLIVFLLPPSGFFIFLGLYTLQTSGLFNVFNFFAVTTVPLALMTGFWLDTLWQRKNILFKLIPILVIGLGLPRIIMSTSEAVSYQTQRKFERAVTPDQQAAFTFVQQHLPATAVIQSHPDHPFNRHTPALAFFTNRPTFLTGVRMLETHNQPFTDRQKTLKNIFESTSAPEFVESARVNQIEYIYLEKQPDQKLRFTLPAAELPIVFENDGVQVMQVN